LSSKVSSLLRYLCMALLAMAVLVPASKADTVNYTFNGSNGSFEYTSTSGFISPDSTLVLFKSDLDSCMGCSSLSFIPSAILSSGLPYVGDLIAFGTLTNGAVYIFQNGAFEAVGTYSSYIGSGTLQVSLGSVPAPEPGTIGMLACGLLLMAGLASRKRLSAIVTARA
jgi:hypothetical protein